MSLWFHRISHWCRFHSTVFLLGVPMWPPVQLAWPQIQTCVNYFAIHVGGVRAAYGSRRLMMWLWTPCWTQLQSISDIFDNTLFVKFVHCINVKGMVLMLNLFLKFLLPGISGILDFLVLSIDSATNLRVITSFYSSSAVSPRTKIQVE